MSDPNELVSHSNSHAPEIAEFISSIDALSDPVTRRDYFGQLDENDFLDLTQRAASLVRTGDASSLQHFDGQTVGLMGHEVPDQREKEALLRETWQVARGFLNNNEIPDHDALDYAALTVAGGLLFAHPFADGNGRTSRALSYMIARGAADEGELNDILGTSSGGGAWQVAPVPLVSASRNAFKGPQPQEIEWEDTLAGEADDVFGGTIANSLYKDEVLRRFIEESGGDVDLHLSKNVHLNDDGLQVLNGEQFMQDLVHDPDSGMTNAGQLLRLHRELRADYVHRFLRSMQSSDPIKPRRIHASDMEVKAGDNDFSRGKKQVIAQEVAARAIGGMLTPADQQLIQHRAYSTLRHPDRG
jgi:hypothetical protein